MIQHSVSTLRAGAPLESARVAVVLLHGRGASAQSVLSLSPELGGDDVAFLAPQASNDTWYPQRFIVPTAQNEPWLSAALEAVGETVALTQLPLERVILAGFSQGACLALEYAVRAGGHFGGVIAFSGGLIGADDEVGSSRGAPITGTPIFIGCDEQDFHIPLERVQRSAQILSNLGAVVDARIYRGLGHAINADELEAARAIIDGALLFKNR
jgi:phospholipase/carboxylesterase